MCLEEPVLLNFHGPMNKTILLLFLFSILFPGCQSTTTTVTPQPTNSCADSLKETLTEGHDLSHLVEQSSGYAMSYLWTGVNYTAEVTWDVATGTVLFVALCAPLFFAHQNRSHPMEGSGVRCLSGKVAKHIQSPPLGRKAYQRTKNWRCPPLLKRIQNLEPSYSCYLSSKNPKVREQGRKSFTALAKSPSLRTCVSTVHRDRLTEVIRKLSDETE